jgi:hypothetical protein
MKTKDVQTKDVQTKDVQTKDVQTKDVQAWPRVTGEGRTEWLYLSDSTTCS